MRIFRRRGVDDIPYDDVKAWFKVALRLQRDDPDLFNTMLASMKDEDLEVQRTNFRAQGWSEEDIEVAAVASMLREARQEGVFKREETGVIGNSPDLPEGTTGESTELETGGRN